MIYILISYIYLFPFHISIVIKNFFHPWKSIRKSDDFNNLFLFYIQKYDLTKHLNSVHLFLKPIILYTISHVDKHQVQSHFKH